MDQVEVAHYHTLLSGWMIWAIFFLAIAIGFAARAVTAWSARAVRPVWLGLAMISAVVIAFFWVAPFVVYGAGQAPSVRGVSMVLAGQAGYASSFLLVGVVVATCVRLLGFKGRFTASFIIGTATIMGLSALNAVIHGQQWLLAP